MLYIPKTRRYDTYKIEVCARNVCTCRLINAEKWHIQEKLNILTCFLFYIRWEWGLSFDSYVKEYCIVRIDRCLSLSICLILYPNHTFLVL